MIESESAGNVVGDRVQSRRKFQCTQEKRESQIEIRENEGRRKRDQKSAVRSLNFFSRNGSGWIKPVIKLYNFFLNSSPQLVRVGSVRSNFLHDARSDLNITITQFNCLGQFEIVGDSHMLSPLDDM